MCQCADLLRFTAYRTDKGSLDKGGLPQPAFLNFDASLLYPPAHTIQVGSCASLHLASYAFAKSGVAPCSTCLRVPHPYRSLSSAAAWLLPEEARDASRPWAVSSKDAVNTVQGISGKGCRRVLTGNAARPVCCSDETRFYRLSLHGP